MTSITPKPKFSLGDIVATPGALDAMTVETGMALLARHQRGDWGDLDAEDRAANDRAAESGEERVLSAYNLPNGTRIWIITEWDRSITTLLLPEEY